MTVLEIISAAIAFYLIYIGSQPDETQRELMTVASKTAHIFGRFLDERLQYAEEAQKANIETRQMSFLIAQSTTYKIPIAIGFLCIPAAGLYLIPDDNVQTITVARHIITASAGFLIVIGLIISLRLFWMGLKLKWLQWRTSLSYHVNLIQFIFTSIPFNILLGWHYLVKDHGLNKSFLIIALFLTAVDKIMIPLLIK